MKKPLILITLFFSACHSANHNGRYVNHSQNEYTITDDTLEVRDTVIIEHTGYQLIRNGILEPKKLKTKQLFELRPVFEGNRLILNQTTYEKL